MNQFIPNVKRVSSTKSPAGDLKRAKALFQEKRFDEALVEFERVLKKDLGSFQARLGAGNIELRQKNYDKALSHFQTAIQIEPLKPKAYLKAGIVYSRKGDLAKALENFENAIKISPKLAIAYALAGQILLRQKKYDRAINQFSKCLRFNPRLIKVRQLLAFAYMRLEKLSEAISQLKSVLRIEPKSYLAYAGLGRIYLIQKEYTEARKACQEAINLNPDISSSVRLILAESLIEEKQLNEAIKVLNTVPKKDEFSAKLHKLWGDIYQSQGLYKEALEEYQAVTLTASEEKVDLDELESLVLLDEQDDEKLEELARSYKTSTSTLLSKRLS